MEVVDARDPIGTRNRKLERMVLESGKKLLIVMNKADLVPKEWAEEYKRRSEIPVIFISARERKGTGILRKELKKIAREIDKEKVKVALIGYPNVGKSTIINVLKGKHAVGTAPIPGYTKGKQLIRLTKRLWLLDTPGVVPIDDFDELVIKGGFPADKIRDPVSPALKLIRRILETRKEALTDKFGIKDFEGEEDILKKIGEKRGLFREGGEVDLEETARWFLREWQTGRFTLFSKDQEKKQEINWDFEEILGKVKEEEIFDPRRILWKFEDKLLEKLDNNKRVGILEVGEFIVGIATGFKKCDSAVKFLENLTGKSVVMSECFGKKWKGIIAILS
ncbi:50S ribosomal subunit maturation GTPase RbgA (B. subtilis YlqF) [Thermococcus chitonophagus]|uniref:50S ribosomal subunit maturation GTPase RbgA (B. subtilis YlqF) n=1 Tax=Thermococcus chitonophagus TaxID=54262 RepID=A0A161K9A9_9EURY|nr:50S ribosomal subunit maturation GTPase RbgA (B. subtilis YlqF) [Thermococcus chitonophagus]